MAAYVYKALDSKGKSLNGIIDADSPKSARAQLRKQGLFPSELTEQTSGSATKGSGVNFEVDFSKLFQRVSAQELAEMTSQLETLLRNSIDVAESLQMLSEQTNNAMLKLALVEIRDEVRQGLSLAAAMRKHPKIFNNLYVSMIEVGQEAGNMDQVLARLKEYTVKMVALQQKVITAVTYPALMGFISVSVVLGLFIGVIPRISTMFDSFGATLPLITRIMLGISNFLQAYWLFIPFIVGISLYTSLRYIKTPKGKTNWHAFLLKIPLFGNLLRMIAISRFTRTLATLLRSGVPLASALPIARNVIGNVILEDAIDKANNNIIRGQSLSEPLAQSGQFPPLMVRMIAVGERTGEIEELLFEASIVYDQRVDSQLSSLTSILEPILIVVLGGFVVLVAISILLPMLNMSALAR